MLPNPTIYIYEAVQGMVDERIERADRRARIHQLVKTSRARKQLRRSIAHSLRNGVDAQDIASEIRFRLRDEARN